MQHSALSAGFYWAPHIAADQLSINQAEEDHDILDTLFMKPRSLYETHGLITVATHL